ncbi:MAG TPA: isoprenylcysteine carboxylmethyltransferase family protein [Pirellulaceae bacterium]|nr:isoprenylcysteine carboxylmethyltransferase family protein [Pirellulaceae bacterium]
MENDYQAWLSRWPLAVIMIVIASWLFYRYAAPQRWREWAGAGLVQAFIIALYAEMYGFPLTIYVLTSFLGIEIPGVHYSGHLWATLLGYGYVGAMVEMFLGVTFVILGILMLMEGWRELYRAVQENRLATEDLYGVVRHPQYTGIFGALFGQLVHWPTIPTLVLFPVIVAIYVYLARKEEQQVIEQFGDEYRRYMHDVPMFFPRFGNWRRLLGAIGLLGHDKDAVRNDKKADPGS